MIRKKFNYAFITGAAGLLGPVFAEALAEKNINLILIDINKKRLDKIYANLKKKFDNIKILKEVIDITNEKKVKSLFKKFKNLKITVKYLINNAENNPKMLSLSSNKSAGIDNYTAKKLRKDIDVGITGTFICSKYFSKSLDRENNGIIINISSDLGINAPDQRVYHKSRKMDKVRQFKPISYSISKHAIIGITKYFATLFANKNIRCNTLSLGPVLNNQPKFLIKNQSDKIPLNRWANKYEYKKAIQFLLDENNSYMTGQNLIIDGGKTIW